MIFERKIPEKIAYYEVMIRRSFDSIKYEKLHNKAKAGFIGESRLDREWQDINPEGILFHDFTCFNEAAHTHQIDTIYVCKHFILVIEVKHLTGEIKINPKTYQCMFHPKEGEPEPIENPIEQVKRHRDILKNYFNKTSINAPIEAVVIMTNPFCRFDSIDPEIPMFVVKGLRSKLAELTKRHQHVNLNISQIKASLEKLYRAHTKEVWRSDEKLRTGVLCLNCKQKMIPSNNGFKCLNCNICDKKHHAIRRTLYDYKILYGPEITNTQFRNFAEIRSRYTAAGILNRHLPKKLKAGRGSKYYIPNDIYTPH